MRGGELMQFRMTDETRRATRGAAAIIVARRRETIPAKARSAHILSHAAILAVIITLRSRLK
jgi:hypothetical protein